MNAQLQKMSEARKAIADSIWSFEPMTSTVITLEDRLAQKTKFVIKAKALMTENFANFFPGEALPTDVFGLIDFFFSPNGQLDVFSWDKL